MTAYIVNSVYYGDDGSIVFNNQDVEETAEQSIDLSGYIQKSGDAMTGTLLVPQLTFSDATIQSSAFTEELKESVQDMQSLTQHINYNHTDSSIHVVVPLQLQDELRFQDGSTMNSATNTPNTSQITYNTQTMVTSIANTTYVSNLTCGNINTGHLTDTTSSLQSQINALSTLITSLQSSSVPVGTILIYAQSSPPPTGFLMCNGAEVSRTTYAALYAVIGNLYANNRTISSSTFWLPDLRQCYVKGAGLNTTYASKMKITVPSASIATFQQMSLQNHRHPYSDQGSGQKDVSGQSISSTTIANDSTRQTFTEDTLTYADGTDFTDAETRPNTLVMNYIIKF